MHGTRKPLRLWFPAMYLFVSSKRGISALELQRELGLAKYQTAWTWLHKLRDAVGGRGESSPLRGNIELDETWVGGVRRGEPGAVLFTDGARSYASPARKYACDHRPINVSTFAGEAHEVLPAIHRVFSLLHRVLLGTYQGGVRRKHLPRYQAEFEFRFNRRTSKQRGLLFQRVLSCAIRQAPPCYWELVGRADAKTPLPLAGAA